MNEKAQFDDMAEIYEENLGELLGKWGGDTEKFAQYKIAHIKRTLKSSPRTILDFGCGTGRSLEYIQLYFPEADIYGCDVSEESLKIASDIIPRERLFVNKSAESLKKMGIEFDLVILACVFHHIAPEEREYWMKGIIDVVHAGGGYVAAYEHNVLNPMTKKIILDTNNKVDDINWMLTHKDLLELMGGKVFWHGYTLFSPIRFKGVLGLESMLKWLPLGAQHCVIIER